MTSHRYWLVATDHFGARSYLGDGGFMLLGSWTPNLYLHEHLAAADAAKFAHLGARVVPATLTVEGDDA